MDPLAILRSDSVGNCPGNRVRAALSAAFEFHGAAAQPCCSRNNPDHRDDGDSTFDVYCRFLGAGSDQSVPEDPIGRAGFWPVFSGVPRRLAYMGNRSAEPFWADKPQRDPRAIVRRSQGSKYLAAQALSIGRGTANFIITLLLMLYLLFFFLRDGGELSRRIKNAIPLREEQHRALFSKFTIVTRAMFRGNLLVAAVQGALGGLIFWVLGIHAAVLWAVVMAFLSLLPAVGAAAVWLPVAIYFLATGAVWKGLVLIAYGAFVIGLVDNLLRPYLVGKDTQMPDYVVLISTLGGIAIFGLDGLVIGPVIAAMFIAIWDIFSASTQTAQDEGTSS